MIPMEKKDNTPKNILTRFSYKEQVYIHTGFYKGRYATIESYNNADKTYTASILDNKETGKRLQIIVKDDELRPVKKLGVFGI